MEQNIKGYTNRELEKCEKEFTERMQFYAKRVELVQKELNCRKKHGVKVL